MQRKDGQAACPLPRLLRYAGFGGDESFNRTYCVWRASQPRAVKLYRTVVNELPANGIRIRPSPWAGTSSAAHYTDCWRGGSTMPHAFYCTLAMELRYTVSDRTQALYYLRSNRVKDLSVASGSSSASPASPTDQRRYSAYAHKCMQLYTD